jgi:RNA polymerase sigma factor (sigma-70 family)
VTVATDDLADGMKRLDDSAVEEFSRTLGPRLLYYFLRKGLSRADAEALAVSCVSKSWMSIGSFKPQGPGSFEHWVFRLARNAWYDDQRRARKRSRVEFDEQILAARAESSELAADEDLVSQVGAALADLPALDREIVRLRHLDSEETFDEIGRRLGIKGSVARVRHHRTLRVLAGRLAHLRRPREPKPGRGQR